MRAVEARGEAARAQALPAGRAGAWRAPQGAAPVPAPARKALDPLAPHAFDAQFARHNGQQGGTTPLLLAGSGRAPVGRTALDSRARADPGRKPRDELLRAARRAADASEGIGALGMRGGEAEIKQPTFHLAKSRTSSGNFPTGAHATFGA